MIQSITGELAGITHGEGRIRLALIRCGPITLGVELPDYLADQLLDRANAPISLHTLFYLEGTLGGGNSTPRLLGFAHPQDRDLFHCLTQVKGLGLRRSLRAMACPPAQMAAWIRAGDLKRLCSLPEIGRKTAEAIIAELRDRPEVLACLTEPVAGTAPAEPDATQSHGPLTEAALAAADILTAWGDRRPDAESALRQLFAADPQAPSLTPDALVREIYRRRAR